MGTRGLGADRRAQTGTAGRANGTAETAGADTIGDTVGNGPGTHIEQAKTTEHTDDTEHAASEQTRSRHPGSKQAASKQAASGPAGAGPAGAEDAASGQAASGHTGSRHTGSGHAWAVGLRGQQRRVADWELAAERRAAARSRELTRQALEVWAVSDPGDVDDIVLIVDELITNAVMHGAGPVRLRLVLDGPLLRGEVSDGSPLAPRPSGVDPGGLDWSEAGRGLMLVSALSADFGARPTPQGKTVWFVRHLHTANGTVPNDAA